jgi:hypothetical protein
MDAVRRILGHDGRAHHHFGPARVRFPIRRALRRLYHALMPQGDRIAICHQQSLLQEM